MSSERDGAPAMIPGLASSTYQPLWGVEEDTHQRCVVCKGQTFRIGDDGRPRHSACEPEPLPGLVVTARAKYRTTSHEAAMSARPRGRGVLDAVVDVLRDIGPAADFATVTEYQARASRGEVPAATDSSIRSRRADAVGQCLVVAVGFTKNPGGRRCQTWAVAP
jgi:hypothetical protein